MNDLNKTLNNNELEDTDLNVKNVYDPFYTPSENIKTTDNQIVKPTRYLYIESYGC